MLFSIVAAPAGIPTNSVTVSSPTAVVSKLLILAILAGVVLIYVSLLPSDDGHLVMCLLTIWMFSSEKYLFQNWIIWRLGITLHKFSIYFGY